MKVQACPRTIFLQDLRVQARPRTIFLADLKVQARPRTIFLEGLRVQARPRTIFLKDLKVQARPRTIFLQDLEDQARPPTIFVKDYNVGGHYALILGLKVSSKNGDAKSAQRAQVVAKDRKCSKTGVLAVPNGPFWATSRRIGS